jgi:hypothetical protein
MPRELRKKRRRCAVSANAPARKLQLALPDDEIPEHFPNARLLFAPMHRHCAAWDSGVEG